MAGVFGSVTWLIACRLFSRNDKKLIMLPSSLGDATEAEGKYYGNTKTYSRNISIVALIKLLQ